MGETSFYVYVTVAMFAFLIGMVLAMILGEV